MNQASDRDAGQPPALILLVTGDSPRSQRARANLANAVEQLANERLTVEYVDLLENTDRITEYGIFATPALIRPRGSGEPAILYGDLSNGPELQRFLAELTDQIAN